MKNKIFLLYGFIVISSGAFAEEASYPMNVHCGANKTTVAHVKKLNPLVYAEVGVGDGSTALAVSKLLPSNAEIHLFDFHSKVSDAAKKLKSNGFTNIYEWGNSYKYRDSYNWTLLELLEKHKKPIFDYIFLDGLHMWETDALTFFLMDKLLKPGGCIDFDDHNWIMINSTTCNPRVYPLHGKMWTKEQMSTQCVKKIVDLLVLTDDRYEKVFSNARNWIFKKIK